MPAIPYMQSETMPQVLWRNRNKKYIYLRCTLLFTVGRHVMKWKVTVFYAWKCSASLIWCSTFTVVLLITCLPLKCGSISLRRSSPPVKQMWCQTHKGLNVLKVNAPSNCKAFFWFVYYLSLPISFEQPVDPRTSRVWLQPGELPAPEACVGAGPGPLAHHLWGRGREVQPAGHACAPHQWEAAECESRRTLAICELQVPACSAFLCVHFG